MSYLHNTRGFTLIEILVVVTIIGLLSAVVLASMSASRARGADAAIQSNLGTARLQAEAYYNTYRNYGVTTGTGACATRGATTIFKADQTVADAIAAAQTHSGGSNANALCATGSSGYSFAIAVRLRSKDAWFCVDTRGSAKEIAGATAPNLRPSVAGNSTDPAYCP